MCVCVFVRKQFYVRAHAKGENSSRENPSQAQQTPWWVFISFSAFCIDVLVRRQGRRIVCVPMEGECSTGGKAALRGDAGAVTLARIKDGVINIYGFECRSNEAAG